jgi:hypothetical protein
VLATQRIPLGRRREDASTAEDRVACALAEKCHRGLGRKWLQARQGSDASQEPLTGETPEELRSRGVCDKCHTMSKGKATISDVLRRAIKQSKRPLLVIERESGVSRGSMMRFVRGDQSLRLDIADKLAAYFGLKVSAAKGRKAR